MNDAVRFDEPVKPLNVAIAFLVVATLLGVCFFTSPVPRTPDGAVPWTEGSLLKALTDALAFSFRIPTPQGFEIKDLVFGVGAGLATIFVCLATCFRAAPVRDDLDLLDAPAPVAPASPLKRQISPLLGAQILLGAFVAFSFLSALWSPLPAMAVGGSIVLLAQVLWALALCHGLNSRSATASAKGMVAVLACAALLTLAYFYQRNPSMRVGYPIGNPLFFAACMIPAVLVSVCGAGAGLSRIVRGRPGVLMSTLLWTAPLIPVLWAIRKADPRSTYVGLAVGLVSAAFLAVRGPARKAAVLGLALAVGVCGWIWWFAPRLADRSDTIRTRLYAWNYAEELFAASPIVGHGQGGYALLGDGLATRDVAHDPWALHAALDHAHNEWLEVAADLGSIGLVLILGCIAVTLLAGVRVLRQIEHPQHRWMLLALLACLPALLAEECFDVALRVAGLPAVYFTVPGLCWALIRAAGPESGSPEGHAGKSTWQKLGLIAGAGIGAVLVLTSVLDWQAARALHTFAQSIEQRQWADAIQQVETAVSYRLSPARRLKAMYSRAWCHLRIAEQLQQDFFDRVAQNNQRPGAPQDPASALARIAEQALSHAELAVILAEDLNSRAGHYLGAHRVTSGAHEVAGRFAASAEQGEAVESHRQAAVYSLSKELERRPFDADLVMRLLELSPPLTLQQIVELICGPLRFDEVDERYPQLVQNLAARPGFDEEFQPILTQALSALLNTPAADGEVRYAAQELTIAAWVQAARGQFAEARVFAANALVLAEREKERFPLAFAIGHRELAHYTFLSQPADPAAAIEIASRGLSSLSTAHAAATARGRISQRLALYYVAQGDEKSASRFIVDHDRLTQEAIEAELASLHLALGGTLLALPHAQRPPYLSERLQRAADLCRTARLVPAESRPLAAMMQAQLAFQSGDPQACVRFWREALALGMDAQRILDLVEQTLLEQPGSPPLAEFRGYLIAIMTGPT